MTTTTEWARIEAALDEILALPEAEWPQAAMRIAGGDAALLSEIRSLLANAGGVDPILDRPLTGPEAAPSAGLEPGTRLGPYELIRKIGAGGMAEVWLARRADGAFKREVALKLPMRSRLREDLDARFARERDILASLEHPQIARLYDAGVTDGVPWLAMEYVQGQSLTDWCTGQALGIEQRLRLVLQVLEAVSYAHARSVIHRDLKPSNILVTEAGQVRLLDFGVAKLLEPQQTDRTELTEIHGRALTADYASPELLCGGAVDARSDLYSLGVLLYELLTGTRPYQLSSAGFLGMLPQAIAAVEVRKPSEHLEQPWARQLRGDLDAIVLKALSKQPAERYASAEDFTADLQCSLSGKPVAARAPGAWYRVMKLARQHRLLSGRTAVAIAAILVAAAVIRFSAPIAEQRVAVSGLDSSRVVQSAPAAPLAIPEKSIAVLPFLDMSKKHDQEYFSDGLAEELLNLLAQVPDLRVPARTSSFYFKGKQETIAEIAKALSVAHVLEGSVRKSGNTVRVTVQLIRADSGYQLWAKTFDRDIKDIFKVQDEVAGAVVEALKAQLVPVQAALNRTANPEAHNQFLLGREFHNRGNLDSLRLAMQAYRKAIALDPNYAAAYAGLALAEHFVADVTGDVAGLKQAETYAEKAVEFGPQEAHGYAARGYLRTTGAWDWVGAQADFSKALALDPTDSRVQLYYGGLLTSFGRLPEAVAALRKAIELDPLSSVAWQNLGRYLAASGDTTGANMALRRALEIQPESSYNFNSLGVLQLMEGQAAEAFATFGKVKFESFRLAGIAMAQHMLSHPTESQQALDELIAKHAQESAYQIAEAYAWRAETNLAFKWLERAHQQHDGGLFDVKWDPLLARLRTDGRYAVLLHEMKLPE